MSDDRKSGYASAFSADEVAALVDEIAARADRPLRLVRRFGMGDGPGAYELTGDDGQSYVLKLLETGIDRFDRAASATALLRSRGYPAPEYIAVGRLDETDYAVQTMCPCKPLAVIGVGEAHITSLLAINDLQADGIDLEGPEWPAPVVDPVLHGGAGFCLLDTMLDHSADTAALMRRLQDVVTSAAPGVPRDRRDLVHVDFNPANVLAAGPSLTGVVDWEAVCTGDRAFDLVTFGVSSPRHRAPFLQRAAELSGKAALRVYSAHVIHRLVEWSVRFYPRNVARSVAQADALLDSL